MVDTGQRKKSKFEIAIPGREPFGMAGVWKPWKNPKTDQWERTFAVITGEPNELMQPIHDRLTTILDPSDYQEYLTATGRPPLHLLRILPSEQMRLTPVEAPGASELGAPDPQLSLFDLDPD
jgi:putative SOS response-associated peptidase YedK